ncbi:MAG: serine/threonine-protein kinase [Anaerolineae bacterium]|nr:serine/threonine-protein kinase [Anaerolineae bacterium]
MVDTRQFANDSDRNLMNNAGALQPNTILQNRYRIENVLGVGGMGSVYKARDLQFPEAQRFVAVKEMLQQSTDPQFRDIALRNFRREANILAALNHPAIPTIHDYFATRERAYLVMEYIDGNDLDKTLGTEPGFLPVSQVMEWAIAVCDVLEYLHNCEPPIIFRDMKPSNIMINSQNRLRLIDFGIAKHFEPGTKGTMIGTEGYAAPESYQGKATPSSDIFGVGATLHHILTNHDPRTETPFTFGERPIRAVNPDVPPELENVVMRAVAFDASERFATASEMKIALMRLLGVGRSASLVAGATTALAVGSAGILDEPDGWGALGDGLTVEPRWSLKVEDEIRSKPAVHKDIVYVTVYDNNLYAVEAETGTLRWKFYAEDELASSPAICEEENLVIFGSKDHILYAVDIRSGRVRWTLPTEGPIFSSPTVKHGHVFFGSDDGAIYAVRVNTGRKAWVQKMHAPIRCKPFVTEDRVLFGTKTGDFFSMDLGGQIKWRFKARREILSSPVVDEGLVFVGSMDGHMYALGLENGWAAWKINTSRPVISSPALEDGRLYFGSVSGIMYCLEAANGRERWKFDVGNSNQITSSPAVANGAVYFGANDHKIYCLDIKNGKERWSYTTKGMIPGSPIVHEEAVYIGSADKHLYAFKA